MNSFNALHVSRTHSIVLNAPVDKVFPLFDPVNEKKWSHGWDFDPVFPADGSAQPGMVFTTHHHGESETIWRLNRIDTVNHGVEYFRLTVGSRLGIISINCSTMDSHSTKATVTYEFTALSEKGNEFILSFSESHYLEWMKEWEDAINHYLATGQILVNNAN
ncbi:SRPBCC family protein [bacterium]|nr:SRPBCC family protein [bacterium]